ncbi:MAG: hypothetical protein L6R40_006384 [Gallowayella cf. fulva]|nr:MAG: hypothetical protein L6R40_006384 [Xanthomendoza cf. fulva]
MPFIPHTPESLLPRSDSKSAATTCKGITQGGRPCRRDLKIQKPNNGILAVVSNNHADDEGAAAFFCYQHKDQAANLASPGPATGPSGLYPLNKRTSTDTLMERLGVLNVHDVRSGHRKKRAAPRSANKDGLPKKWQDVPGPLLAVSTSEKPGLRPGPRRRRPHPLLTFLCCGAYDDEDPLPVAAPTPRKQATSSAPEFRNPPVSPRTHQPTHSASRKDDRRRSSSTRPILADKSTNQTHRPTLPQDTSSQTSNLLALIPKTLSPQTTSALLSELAKPLSPHDEEGYIYMFRLTPTSTSPSPINAASALLSPSTPAPSPRARTATSSPAPPFPQPAAAAAKTILLKIGRASNVQRRMNEWTRQCGYDLNLIRYYPYIPSPSSPLSSPSKLPSLPPSPVSTAAPRKVPHAHRVERLVHLELAEKRVKRVCEACGKEHREWFEVEGSREGVKGVDEVVRRWARWGEGMK